MGLPRRDGIDARAGRLWRVDVLDAELRIVGGRASLLFDDIQRGKIQQQLADLAGVGRIAALADGPAGRALLQRGFRVIALRQLHFGDGVDALFETRQNEIARGRRALQMPLRGEPDRQHDDQEAGDEQDDDAAGSHGATCPEDWVERRRRRATAMSSAAIANAIGTRITLMTFTSVPRR